MKKELRVYAVAVSDFEVGEYNFNVSDERFMDLAENAGTVWSLKGFQDAFNSDECPSPYDSYIRFIEVGAL